MLTIPIDIAKARADTRSGNLSREKDMLIPRKITEVMWKSRMDFDLPVRCDYLLTDSNEATICSTRASHIEANPSPVLGVRTT